LACPLQPSPRLHSDWCCPRPRRNVQAHLTSDEHSQVGILASLSNVRCALVHATARVDLAFEAGSTVGVGRAVVQRVAALALRRAEADAVGAQDAQAVLVVAEAGAGARVVLGDAAAHARVCAAVRHRHHLGLRRRRQRRSRRGGDAEAAARRHVGRGVAAG